MLVPGGGAFQGAPREKGWVQGRVTDTSSHQPTGQCPTPLPDSHTLGVTPTAPQYSQIGASNSATTFPTGLFSVTKPTQRTKRNSQNQVFQMMDQLLTCQTESKVDLVR